MESQPGTPTFHAPTIKHGVLNSGVTIRHFLILLNTNYSNKKVKNDKKRLKLLTEQHKMCAMFQGKPLFQARDNNAVLPDTPDTNKNYATRESLLVTP